MLNFEKHLRTKNPVLRLIGNTSGSISNYFLIKEIHSEDKDNVGRAKLYAKLFRIFEGPQNKWGTYYTAELKSIKGNNEWTRSQTYKKFNN
jgi:hypothetical protein